MSIPSNGSRGIPSTDTAADEDVGAAPPAWLASYAMGLAAARRRTSACVDELVAAADADRARLLAARGALATLELVDEDLRDRTAGLLADALVRLEACTPRPDHPAPAAGPRRPGTAHAPVARLRRTPIVVVAHDRDLRSLVRRRLAGDSRWHLAGEAGGHVEGVAVVSRLQPDICLLGATMPAPGGPLLPHILRVAPRCMVAVYTGSRSMRTRPPVIELGAFAYYCGADAPGPAEGLAADCQRLTRALAGRRGRIEGTRGGHEDEARPDVGDPGFRGPGVRIPPWPPSRADATDGPATPAGGCGTR